MLGTNHRSARALVEAVNTLFARAEVRPGAGAFGFGPALPFEPVTARGRAETLVATAGPVPAITWVADATPRLSREHRPLCAALAAERIVGLPAVHDPGYEPLWSYLAEAGVPIAIHPGLNGAIPDPFLRDRFDDDFTTMHAVHFPVEQMMNVTSFIGFGILERHPGLRVAFLECGAGWVPYYLHRLDEHLEVFGFPRGSLTMKPSEYFRRQCFVSVEEVEPLLQGVLDAYPESITFASDYPHGDGTSPGATAELLVTDALTPAQKRAVLHDNARRLYAL